MQNARAPPALLDLVPGALEDGDEPVEGQGPPRHGPDLDVEAPARRRLIALDAEIERAERVPVELVGEPEPRSHHVETHGDPAEGEQP